MRTGHGTFVVAAGGGHPLHHCDEEALIAGCGLNSERSREICV